MAMDRFVRAVHADMNKVFELNRLRPVLAWDSDMRSYDTREQVSAAV